MFAALQPTTPPEPLVIEGGTLFDGTGAVRPGAAIVVRGGRIEEVGSAGRVAVPARRGRGDVSLGNVLGTIVHFTCLNAGVIALIRPLELDDVTRALHLPVAVVSSLLLALVLWGRGGLGRIEGALFVGLYAAYVSVAVALS